MTKTGWWSVNFTITLEREDVPFEDLSEASQEHILEMIKNGYGQGEVVEECNDDEDDEDEDCDYCCDECNINGYCERQEHMDDDEDEENEE